MPDRFDQFAPAIARCLTHPNPPSAEQTRLVEEILAGRVAGAAIDRHPPGLAQLALALIAELHGRCGYFPTIVNLQAARDTARARR